MDLDDAVLERTARLIRGHRYSEALELLGAHIAADQPNWNALYLAGQCHRFLGDFDSAVAFLSRASVIPPREAPVFLALGIALQLAGRLDEAKKALGHAIDADYALAFNSLAMTQKLGGELEKAAHNYDAGCQALARAIVKALAVRNERQSPILKHRDTRGTLWMEYAMYGALYMVALEPDLTGMAMPTGEQAVEEERTEKHGGLYWEDVVDAKGDSVRLFLPNYFNTFRETLKRDPAYANLVGNRATVLELMNREREAQSHRDDAIEFLPVAG